MGMGATCRPETAEGTRIPQGSQVWSYLPARWRISVATSQLREGQGHRMSPVIPLLGRTERLGSGM